MLLNDEKLFNKLNNAAANLDKLILGLKAYPKRYVGFFVVGLKKIDTIKSSLFFPTN